MYTIDDEVISYRVVEKEGFTVVGKTIRVTKDRNQITKFWEEAMNEGLLEELQNIEEELAYPLLGISFDYHPEDQSFSYMIGIETKIDEHEVFEVLEVPSNKYLVSTTVGPLPKSIQDAFDYTMNVIAKKNNYEITDGPMIELYPAGDTSGEAYECQAWIPIK